MSDEQAKTKVCKCCGQELPVEYFCKNRATKDGLQIYCKDCQKKKIAESRIRRKERTLLAQAESLESEDCDQRKLTWDKKAEAKELLKTIPDSEILTEIRRRGYIGTIYKKIEVVL